MVRDHSQNLHWRKQRRFSYQVPTWALPARNGQTLAKALCLKAERSSKAPALWKVIVEQRRLGDCCPDSADLRISSDHGDQVGAGRTLLILRWF
jgi:hypothetical protein